MKRHVLVFAAAAPALWMYSSNHVAMSLLLFAILLSALEMGGELAASGRGPLVVWQARPAEQPPVPAQAPQSGVIPAVPAAFGSTAEFGPSAAPGVVGVATGTEPTRRVAGARPADRREPGHHLQQDTRHLGGRPPSAARALAAGPDRGVPAPEPGGEGAFPSPPLFARQPTAAHSSLWHLPVRPVQPAVAADDASLGDVGLLATSIVGTGHRCAEPAEPRQDAYRVARDDPGEHVIVAVADGISSCRFSDLAAAVAVSAAVNTVRRMLADQPEFGQLSATELFDAMAEQMRDAADQRRISLADFGVVAIVAVIPTRGEVHDGSRKVWMGWLGDVSAWELLADRWSPVTGKAKADDDGVESGEIDAALPWAPHAARSGILTVPGRTTMAFVTDGVGDALGNNPRINRYFSRVWASKPPLTEFINDMSFDAPSCQDDRTAVVIWTGQ